MIRRELLKHLNLCCGHLITPRLSDTSEHTGSVLHAALPAKLKDMAGIAGHTTLPKKKKNIQRLIVQASYSKRWGSAKGVFMGSSKALQKLHCYCQSKTSHCEENTHTRGQVGTDINGSFYASLHRQT